MGVKKKSYLTGIRTRKSYPTAYELRPGDNNLLKTKQLNKKKSKQKSNLAEWELAVVLIQKFARIIPFGLPRLLFMQPE